MAGGIGRLLRGVRANERHSVWNAPGLQAPETIAVSSSSFAHLGPIPCPRHRGEGAGDNVSPALAWTGIPDAAAQLLLVIEDTDVPLPRPIIHTVALLDPALPGLAEGELDAATPGVEPRPASFGRTGYQGPRPVAGHGVHHYGFMVFALDAPLGATANAKALLAAAAGHVLARGRVIGTDER